MRLEGYDNWKDCSPDFDTTEIEGDHMYCKNCKEIEFGIFYCEAFLCEVDKNVKRHDCGEFLWNPSGKIEKEFI